MELQLRMSDKDLIFHEPPDDWARTTYLGGARSYPASRRLPGTPPASLRTEDGLRFW